MAPTAPARVITHLRELSQETNGASAFALAPSFEGYVEGYRYSDFTEPHVVLRVGVALGQPEPRLVETPAPPCQRA